MLLINHDQFKKFWHLNEHNKRFHIKFVTS